MSYKNIVYALCGTLLLTILFFSVAIPEVNPFAAPDDTVFEPIIIPEVQCPLTTCICPELAVAEIRLKADRFADRVLAELQNLQVPQTSGQAENELIKLSVYPYDTAFHFGTDKNRIAGGISAFIQSWRNKPPGHHSYMKRHPGHTSRITPIVSRVYDRIETGVVVSLHQTGNQSTSNDSVFYSMALVLIPTHVRLSTEDEYRTECRFRLQGIHPFTPKK